jgi:hypothetical protein
MRKEEAMRNVIKFNGRLYAMLEEGAHTIQGEIVHVVASKSKLNKTLETIGHKCPTHEAWYELISEIAKRVKCLPSYFPDDNGHILKAIDSFSQPDSRECCNCEYHLTKKANDEVALRDEMLGMLRVALTVAKEIIDTNLEIQRGCDPDYFLIRQALALPLPATTLRLEAERKVIEAARNVIDSVDPQHKGSVEMRLKDALSSLDSLGGGK